VDDTRESADLIEAIYTFMSLQKLTAALEHFTDGIRLIAFQTIRSIVFARATRQMSGCDAIASIDQEIALWKIAFPYAIKAEGKEYKSTLLQCLTSFIDRISIEESASLLRDDIAGGSGVPMLPLPRFHSFVVDFLIFKVSVQQSAYPSSIAEKEAFAIELLGCILDYVSRDYNYVPRNVTVYDRKRTEIESEAATRVIESLLSREAIAALLSLLHSIWDGTRSASFRLISRLVLTGQSHQIALGPEYTSSSNRSGMEVRAVYLASSPRQRESDTGARLLAFLYLSLSNRDERGLFLAKLANLLETRLTMMKGVLAALIRGEMERKAGAELALSHGLVQALRLIIESDITASNYFEQYPSPESHETYTHLATIFCRAINISLTVVADLKEGETVDGMDEDLIVKGGDRDDRQNNGTPLNVNTGCIGANGTFSSVISSEKDEQENRIATQRVVVSPNTPDCCPVSFSAIVSLSNIISLALVNFLPDGLVAPHARDLWCTVILAHLDGLPRCGRSTQPGRVRSD